MMEIQKPPQKAKVGQIPWVQKYRPHELSQLISHKEIIRTLGKFIAQNSIPNLLFYGPPGTGKTSTIIALAKQLYGDDYSKMVLQLNASDERGIAVVRQQIKSFAGSMTLAKTRNTKLIILDQADMMTSVAQFALRRIIQKSSNNARFCLISNYVSKIIPALQSRCTRFKFKQVSYDECLPRIRQISESEKLDIDEDGVKSVYKLCGGDMRRVVNMLQSLSMKNFEKSIGTEQVYNFTGNPTPKQIENLMDIILNQSSQQAFYKICEFKKVMGVSMDVIVQDFYQLLLNMDLPQKQVQFLAERLANLQYRLSIGVSESTVLASLIGAFTEIKFLSSA